MPLRPIFATHMNAYVLFQNFDQFCVMVDKCLRLNISESMSRRQWSTDEFSTVLSAHTEMVGQLDVQATVYLDYEALKAL